MNEMVQNMAGMGGMSDQVIATDFLIATKTGIKNYALALTETYTPELRRALQDQLNTAIEAHEKATNYMVSKGYYHPMHVEDQLHVDLKAARTALNLPQQ